MKKYLVLIFFAAAIIGGCSNNAKVKQLVSQHFEALNKHDIAALTSAYAANCKLSSTGWEGPRTGPDAIKGAYTRYFQSTPDLKYKITNAIFTDTTAVIEYTSWGSIPTNDATIAPYMAGKKFSLQNCAVMHIKNNQIVYEATYFDQVSFLRQVGYFDQPAGMR